MAISNEELISLVKKLPESARKSAYDYMKFLSISHSRHDWEEIMKMDSDEIPLSEEEKRQLENTSEFVSWEDAMHELNLPTDTKS